MRIRVRKWILGEGGGLVLYFISALVVFKNIIGCWIKGVGGGVV